ncbi:MAG TPA: lysine 2,3-aminomutase, partial [Chloroflexi bacterium]|nr:lysine 2,3-aminomutase [Chloroflexota bacterium]
VDHGIPVGCQTVLLRGVNDDPEVMKQLMHELLKARVKPYYIYQADLVKGTDYFRTSVQKGLEIMEALQGHTTGFGVPQYIIDAPGGGGKIPVTPERIVELTEEKIVLRNYEGRVYEYPAAGHASDVAPGTLREYFPEFNE